MDSNNEAKNNCELCPIDSHPNGMSFRSSFNRPERNIGAFFEDIFPDSYLGRLLKGLIVEFLIKQEHRLGWARKSACDDDTLTLHPNESVASHQWGVARLVMVIAREPKFQEELPQFDRLKAIEMALSHDVAEIITGDITPVDGISQEEKHKAESEAMVLIMGNYLEPVRSSLHSIYFSYEDRKCPESKFVKDCDRLDFIIQAFILERQGFTGFAEFYSNTVKNGFSTEIAKDLADLLLKTRNELFGRGQLYRKNC